MNINLQKLSTSDKVLEKIKQGQVKMRPKIYFILKTLLVVLGIIISTLFALYLISFIVFALRASGAWYLSGFGFEGMKASIVLIPWVLILVALILIIVLEILVKRFSFSYRQPIFYTLLGIIIFVFLGSFAIGKTGFHTNLFQRARDGRLPVAESFYRGFGMGKFKNVHRGTVSELKENGFTIKTRRGDILIVIITEETRFLFEGDVEIDDMVIIMGEVNDNTVVAIGVRRVNDEIGFLLKKPMLMHLEK
ncbi:MAG: hypothetical protein U9Q96_01190 [Patescibacteria group bacterium]|nr:hypothetical protein [Patescibacteria group bacterium]